MRYKRDFSKKAFHNPHSAFQARKRRVRGVGKAFILALGAIALVGVYFLVWSPFLRVKNFIVSVKTLPTRDIEALARETMGEGYLSQNLLLYPVQNLKAKIHEEYPIHSVEVKKKYPDTIEIRIVERESVLTWISDTHGYQIDKDGKVIREIDRENVEKLNSANLNIVRHKILSNNSPLIFQKNPIQFLPSQKVTTEKYFLHLKTIIFSLREKNFIKITYFEYILSDHSLVAFTLEGWKVYFSLNEPPEGQLAKLEVIMNNQTTVGKIVDYIDLRFGDKIFYK